MTLSLPAWGAWLEINNFDDEIPIEIVAPRMGSVSLSKKRDFELAIWLLIR